MSTPISGLEAAFNQALASSGDLTVHEAAADPHPVYQLRSEKDTPTGYAGLDAASRIVKGVDTQDDLVIDLATKGIVFKDTQATPHYWRLNIDNSGGLVVTDLGTVKP